MDYDNYCQVTVQLGFEPKLKHSECFVLPLHYWTKKKLAGSNLHFPASTLSVLVLDDNLLTPRGGIEPPYRSRRNALG